MPPKKLSENFGNPNFFKKGVSANGMRISNKLAILRTNAFQLSPSVIPAEAGSQTSHHLSNMDSRQIAGNNNEEK